MHRKPILSLLENYFPDDLAEQTFKNKMVEFIKNEPNCFERSLLKGHITGSAFIVNVQKTKTLLVNHAKLNRWLQPGGHCDGDANVAKVSLKEALEETGLTQLQIRETEIFDIDIHTIPERKGVPEHLHYDVRFLIVADETEPIKISDESTDVKWIPIIAVEKYNNEESVLRMVRKIV
jgi:8-oxo-dGTP pyrophosphatase MutT (NUDIX family)